MCLKWNLIPSTPATFFLSINGTTILESSVSFARPLKSPSLYLDSISEIYFESLSFSPPSPLADCLHCSSDHHHFVLGLLWQPPVCPPVFLHPPPQLVLQTAVGLITQLSVSLPCRTIPVASQISYFSVHDLVPAWFSHFISCHCPPAYCALVTLVVFYFLLHTKLFSQGLGISSLKGQLLLVL